MHDYLAATGTEADLQRIDDEAVFWQKRRSASGVCGT